MEFSLWVGLFAPKGTPDHAVARVREETRKAVANEQFAKAIQNIGDVVAYLDQPDFAKFWDEDAKRVEEAVRATGASFMSVVIFGVMPQVMGRFVGFCTYQLDSNLRNSTMVGIVGAGGIGGTLFAAFLRFEYDFVLAIILVIVALVMTGELLANQVKKLFNAKK